jgi:hypothetical protein
MGFFIIQIVSNINHIKSEIEKPKSEPNPLTLDINLEFIVTNVNHYATAIRL